ncbi:hypothetical protein P3T40_001324 [Paraburkholderia sp. EB58]|jgi:hypothetical protein|uniref:hypothetical protein n=1 Tax=Paraburkholderia sp. EB58 TaxID=3035125 RepID=UPI003D201100
MERYRNLSGDSGVDAYALGVGCIAVRFKSGATYWYTDASAGAEHVAEMSRLAQRGLGLSTYISTHPDVSAGYARKDPDD